MSLLQFLIKCCCTFAAPVCADLPYVGWRILALATRGDPWRKRWKDMFHTKYTSLNLPFFFIETYTAKTKLSI